MQLHLFCFFYHFLTIKKKTYFRRTRGIKQKILEQYIITISSHKAHNGRYITFNISTDIQSPPPFKSLLFDLSFIKCTCGSFTESTYFLLCFYLKSS